MVYVNGRKFSVDSSAVRHAYVARDAQDLGDGPVSRMQPWCVESTQVTDSVKQKVVNDVSFGSEVRILATTLPQFSLSKSFKLRVFRFRSD